MVMSAFVDYLVNMKLTQYPSYTVTANFKFHNTSMHKSTIMQTKTLCTSALCPSCLINQHLTSFINE